MVKGDVEKEVADSSVKANAQFVYHRSDVIKPPKACSHFQRVSTMRKQRSLPLRRNVILNASFRGEKCSVEQEE
jgi:hypothetical protein